MFLVEWLRKCPSYSCEIIPQTLSIPNVAYNRRVMTNDKAPIEDKTRLISFAEAAELYGFSHIYLTELARKGRLQAQKVGTMWITTPENVEAYIRSRKKKGVYRDDIQA